MNQALQSAEKKETLKRGTYSCEIKLGDTSTIVQYTIFPIAYKGMIRIVMLHSATNTGFTAHAVGGPRWSKEDPGEWWSVGG